MSKSDSREINKQRQLADLEHLRVANKIDPALYSLKRLFGPNSLAAQLEAEAQRLEPVTEPETTVTDFVPDNVVSIAGRAVQMSDVDRIKQEVAAAYPSEGVEHGIQIEEFGDSVAA